MVALLGAFLLRQPKMLMVTTKELLPSAHKLVNKTHRQELGTINQDVVHTNSPQRHDTYVYYFADGSRSTLVLGADDTSCVNGAWIAELRELDRLEYNNQHTQTTPSLFFGCSGPRRNGRVLYR